MGEDITRKQILHFSRNDMEHITYEKVLDKMVFSLILVDLPNDLAKKLNNKGKTLAHVTMKYSENVDQILESIVCDEKDLIRMKDELRIENIRKNLSKDKKFVDHFSTIMPNGNFYRLACEISYYDENKELVVLIFRNITELFQKTLQHQRELGDAVEKMQKAIQMKNAFFSNLSHDMRTPLNGVIGFTEVALRSNDLDKIHDDLRDIRQSAELLKELVDDALNLSKIESGTAELHYEKIEIDEVIQSIANVAEINAKKRELGFVLNTSQASHCDYIYTDKLMFEQIILNLLSNALKFTPPSGTVTLKIDALEAKEDGCNTRISVMDTGIGMTEQFLPKAFEPFTQDVERNLNLIQGNGLGLSIVKGYVNLLHGHIEIQSRINEGTRVEVYLPMKKENRSLEDRSTRKSYVRNLAGSRILVAEDHPLNYQILKALLERKEIQVERAENGKKAVEQFASHPGRYDVILMDIRMPEMDGIEATQRIRALDDEHAKTIPIIATSANAYQSDINQVLDAGMNAHIAKPIDPTQLYETISSML